MFLTDLMNKKSITKYRLSKESGIPYTTINDICSGKTQLKRCTAEHVYRIAKVFDVSVEQLLAPCFEQRMDFELFKSNVCHRLKELGDIEFIANQLKQDEISDYYNKKWYPESLYLLGLLDYVSRINEVPLCSQYDEIRKTKLKSVLFPAGILTLAEVSGNDEILQDSLKEAIPELLRFNIVESEIRNVV
ncbi:MAG: helix-turn-helix transcriptional regulator [Erysipelotrichaceae bacterium]|nr:helix-turn-helix transcriptional regulator [Erysipelotrichaceae bacterium]